MKEYTNKQIGNAGEKYVAEYLKKRGHKILTRNYRKTYGEIDIISRDGAYTVFTEVKTRKADTSVLPSYAVDRSKRRHIVAAASSYLAENGLDCYCRFDICEVYINPENLKPVRIVHYKNAFNEGD